MKKLSLTEVKRRIRNHEALPDDVVKWYPKLMSRYTIRKVKRNPRGFTGKESRPWLKRYGKGEYRRSARSKELYPRAFVKNPRIEVGDTVKVDIATVRAWDNIPPYINLVRRIVRDGEGTAYVSDIPYDGAAEIVPHAGVAFLSGAVVPIASLRKVSSNPSRISRIKSHVKAHLDKDQRDFQKEIDEDDELKMWLDRNPKFSASQRRKYAASGVALPDGSFPIRNRKDLMDALYDLGRTKHYAAAKRHIIKRARALGLTADLNPEWVRRKGKKRNPKRYHRMRNGDLVLAR